MTMQRPRICTLRALGLGAAVLLTVCLGLAVLTVVVSGGYKSKFIGFEYRLETRRGGAVTRHDVALALDTSVVPDAPVLWSCVTRFPSRASLYAGRLPESREARVHLTQAEVKVVERAIRKWKGGRRDADYADDWAEPPNWEGEHPLLLFRANLRSDSWTGESIWRGYQIEAFGPAECSAARGLIQSINQALPASVRKNHALPLPPEKK